MFLFPPPPLTPSRPTWPHPNPYRPHLSHPTYYSLCCLDMRVCRAFHWTMANLPMTTHGQKPVSALAGIRCQQLGAVSLSPLALSVGMLSSFVLCSQQHLCSQVHQSWNIQEILIFPGLPQSLVLTLFPPIFCDVPWVLRGPIMIQMSHLWLGTPQTLIFCTWMICEFLQ